jgi:hypothetical protein
VRRLWVAIVPGIILHLAVMSANLRAEWNFGVFLGEASTRPGDLHLEQPIIERDLWFEDMEYDDASFRSPLYYGFRAAYFHPSFSNVGFELEFIHAKVYSRSEQIVRVSGTDGGERIDSLIRLGDMVQGFSMTHGLNFLFLNVVGRYPVIKDRGTESGGVTVYGRVGIGPLIPHVESVVDHQKREQYELHGPAYQLAGGVEIGIFKRLGLIAEYKYTFVSVRRAKIAHGHASTEVSTSHWVFGLSAAL